jgi:hypothetical protein
MKNLIFVQLFNDDSSSPKLISLVIKEFKRKLCFIDLYVGKGGDGVFFLD